MSVPVALDDLARTLGDFGAGYLLSTCRGRVKVVTVDPEIGGGALRVTAPGRGTLANVAADPQVTLVFWPLQPRGLSLIVDATAVASGQDLVVTASGAVLHRPAAHADGPVDPDGCGHDCAPLR